MKIRMLVSAAILAGVVPALASAGATAMHPSLSAKLVGKSEVPAGAMSGHGIVNLTLSSGKGTVCWTFEGVGGTDKPTAAHIHKAAAGKAGAVVVPLGASYRAKGCQKATQTMIDGIESHPNAYYVNVHTAKYPNGAIRGQLVAGMMHM